MQDGEILRKIHLIELLKEENEDARLDPGPEALSWTLSEIKAYFSGFPTTFTPTFDRFFPSANKFISRSPKLLLFAFPSSGNAEDMFTSEGTGPRRKPSPLLDYARAHEVLLLSTQYPGRGARRNDDEPITSARAMACAIFDVVRTNGLLAFNIPLAIIAHSVGCWVGYEFLRLCQQYRTTRHPLVAIMCGMPPPDISTTERPWTPNRGLDDTAFRKEVAAWGANKELFGSLWSIYEPILRADYTMFDEYPGATEPLTCPIVAMWGDGDTRITEQMVHGWSRFGGSFELIRCQGPHMWPIHTEFKTPWLRSCVQVLERAMDTTITKT